MIETLGNKNFNSHPHKEDDRKEELPMARKDNFNSHPHKEDDDVWNKIMHRAVNFNSHPHKEDDEYGIGGRS